MATNFGRSGRRYAQEAEFSPVQITGGAGSDAGAAAGIVSLGKLYGANRQSSMKPDEIVMESVAARHRERATITEAQAATHSAGMSSVANKRVAEIQAEAAKKATDKALTKLAAELPRSRALTHAPSPRPISGFVTARSNLATGTPIFLSSSWSISTRS